MKEDYLEAMRIALDQERAKIASVREQNPPSSLSRSRGAWALLATLFLLFIVVAAWGDVIASPSFVFDAILISGGATLTATLVWRWTRGKRMPAIMRHRIIDAD